MIFKFFRGWWYWVLALAISELFLVNTVLNRGFFTFQGPGFTGIYYFGMDPALWGFTTGILLMVTVSKALAQRHKLLQAKLLGEVLDSEP